MKSIVVAALALVGNVFALDNGAARTPPMGFSTWNRFKCHFDSSALLEVATVMNSSGMVAAGYKSLNIDDCWPLKNRSASGALVPDPEKFPNGMLSFSNELSSMNVQLGIYTAHGELTCQKYPGSFGHEEQDVAQFRSWNVVFVKNDWCWHNEPNTTAHLNAFNTMRDAMAKSPGTPMTYSIHWNYADTPGPGCELKQSCPVPTVANMWRVGGDISASWPAVLRLIDTAQALAQAAGPGSWNDMDMLEVGNGMTAEQDRAHFSMWCIMASPLIAGNDLRTMSATTLNILTNTHAIAINQDPLGHQATIVQGTTDNTTQVWAKRLADGGIAVAVLNRDSVKHSVTIVFKNLPGAATTTDYDVLDLWANGTSTGTKSGTMMVSLVPTSCNFYKFVPKSV